MILKYILEGEKARNNMFLGKITKIFERRFISAICGLQLCFRKFNKDYE